MSYRSDNVNPGEYAHGSRWGFGIGYIMSLMRKRWK